MWQGPAGHNRLSGWCLQVSGVLPLLLLALPLRCFQITSARSFTPYNRGIVSRFAALDPPAVFRSDRYSPPLVGCFYIYSLRTDGLVCREVTGLRHKWAIAHGVGEDHCGVNRIHTLSSSSSSSSSTSTYLASQQFSRFLTDQALAIHCPASCTECNKYCCYLHCNVQSGAEIERFCT